MLIKAALFSLFLICSKSLQGPRIGTVGFLKLRERFEDADFYKIDVLCEHPKVSETAVNHYYSFQKWTQNVVIADHNREAIEEVRTFVKNFYGGSKGPHKIILDSGCGLGMSTCILSQTFPDLPVIGIDRSEIRLSKGNALGRASKRANTLLVRADLVDFWFLATFQSSWIVQEHYILYPNPYPKSQHLKRRWHGHPVFPMLLALG